MPWLHLDPEGDGEIVTRAEEDWRRKWRDTEGDKCKGENVRVCGKEDGGR